MSNALKDKVGLRVPGFSMNAEKICILIAFASFALMAVFAGKTSLWADDLFTIAVSQKGQPISYAIKLILEDSHSQPPLFYLFTYVWMRIAPYGTFWLKLPSMLFVTVGIYLCGRNAKKLKGERAAIFASLFAGTSYFLIQQAAYTFRQYGLLFMLVNLLIWFYMKRMDNAGKERISNIVSYGVVMILVLYLHYFGLIVAGAFFLGDLYLYFRKKIKWTCVISYGVAGFSFAPWFLYALKIIMGRNGEFWASAPTLQSLRELVFTMFGYSRLLFLIFFVTAILLFIKSTFYNDYINRHRKFVVCQLIFVYVFVVGATYIYSRYIHPTGSFFVQRYFISILPMLIIVSAIGLDLIVDSVLRGQSNKYTQVVFAIIFAALTVHLGESAFSSVYSTPYLMNQPFEQVTDWIYSQEEVHNSDSMMLTSTTIHRGLTYYITHDGNRPAFPCKSSSDFVAEGNISWSRIYRFDGHGSLSAEANDILQQYYELVEENTDYNVQVYQKKGQ